jgi:hypothetical protein
VTQAPAQDDPVPDDVISPVRALQLAHDDLAERRRIGAELEQAREALQRAREERDRLRAVADRERTDVERLESGSVTRVWSSLRGRLDTDLARERAEAEEALLALIGAEREIERLRRTIDDLAERSRSFDGADSDEQAALEALAAGGFVGDGIDPSLVSYAGAEVARRRELRELEVAAGTVAGAIQTLRAFQALAAAARAASWADLHTRSHGTATYERIGEMVEHLGVANDAVHAATSRLDRVGLLPDGGLPTIEVPVVDRLARLLDAWFDVAAIDHEVGRALETARLQVDTALAHLEQALAALRRRMG